MPVMMIAGSVSQRDPISTLRCFAYTLFNNPTTAVNGQIIDATGFLDDHPGGRKAILLYKGRDGESKLLSMRISTNFSPSNLASDEFNLLHNRNVIDKYYKEGIIGTFKE